MTKLNPCICGASYKTTSALYENFKMIEVALKSGDRRFQIKCVHCGGLGPKRKTFQGAELAWNGHMSALIEKGVIHNE